MINELLAQQKITKYRLAKDSGVPYSTLVDICSNKTPLSKCSSETVYRLAKQLHVTMEYLLDPLLAKRIPFELFKSNVCHQLHRLDDAAFVIQTLKNDTIREYYQRAWYPECFYLLALLDYLCRVNGAPLCNRYDDLRKRKLSKPLYPSSVIALSIAEKSEKPKQEAVKHALPEFLRFNIIEGEVRDAI